MAGENPPTAWWEGPLELRAGNGPPVPAVTGKEVRVSQTRIQVEPRTLFMFALSPNRLRAFFRIASEAVSRGDNVGAQGRAQDGHRLAGSARRRRSYRPGRERAEA